MAIASVGQLFSFQNRDSNNTTFVPTYSSARSSGQLFIITVAMDNLSVVTGEKETADIPVPTCSAGNTYTKYYEFSFASGSAGTGVTVATFYSISTASVTTTNTLSFTFSANVVAKTIVGWAFSYDTTKSIQFPAIDSFQSLPIKLGLSNSSAPSFSIGATNGDLMYRVCGVEASGVAAITATSGWTAGPSIGTSGAGSGLNISAALEFRIANSSATFTSAPTFGSADRADHVFLIREVSASAPRKRYLVIGS